MENNNNFFEKQNDHELKIALINLVTSLDNEDSIDILFEKENEKETTFERLFKRMKSL